MKIFRAGLMVGFMGIANLAGAAEGEKEATSVTPIEAVQPALEIPKFIFTYTYAKYDLQGESSANTGIYKFDKSTVDLHVLTGTWLYSADWTLLAIAPYIKNMIETVYEPTAQGLNFRTKDFTEGLGDLRLMGISPIFSEGSQSLSYDVGATLPTGRIDTFFTSAPAQRAAYNMQPGSGTVDAIGGLTYRYAEGGWAADVRGQLTARSGKNANGYALGNEAMTTLSGKYQFNPYISTGAIANYKIRDKVQGRDEKYELNNAYASPVDPNVQGDGHQYYHAPQVNWDTSLTVKVQTAQWSRVSASLEAGVPVAQGAINKDDLRLDIKSWVSASLNTVF